jgi:2-oxoisovalerate dehydrogenase E2 component (dihydrolipoyl transacylase)
LATITSRYDGVIKTLYYKVNENCLVGSTLVDIELEEQHNDLNLMKVNNTMIQRSNTEVDVSYKESKFHNDKILSTPAVRKIAKENSVNLSNVPASGRDGRVLKEDILSYLCKIDNNIQTEEIIETKIKKNTEELTKTFSAKKYVKYMWKSMTHSLVSPITFKV